MRYVGRGGKEEDEDRIVHTPSIQSAQHIIFGYTVLASCLVEQPENLHITVSTSEELTNTDDRIPPSARCYSIAAIVDRTRKRVTGCY
jgi:hypothetical protein